MAYRWLFILAWRDGRRAVKPLFLSVACVILAVASVVIAYSFRDKVQTSVQTQSKTLLGADLAIDGRQPFSPEAEAFIRSIGGDQSSQISFTSMVYFPATRTSRLVQVRAIRGRFPYYGTLETSPSSAAEEFLTGADALVDSNLMLQAGVRAGDHVRIGDQEFRIDGQLRKIPGEVIAFSLITPRVYIPLDYFKPGELLQRGSIVRYRVYVKLGTGTDIDRVVERITPELSRLHLELDTVKRRTAGISEALDNLSRYLRLAVFIAVLLAGVGVASGIHVYAKNKTASVAVLRCLGAPPAQTVIVFLIQVFAMTIGGSLVGAAVGAFLQSLLPEALKDFLPISADYGVSPTGIAAGLAIGLGTALLFSLIPLAPLRKISPLLALRSSYEDGRRSRDWIVLLVGLAIVASIAAFAIATTDSPFFGLWFTGGVLFAFVFLAGVSRALIALIRRQLPAILPFSWRQGAASLHRPNNQTTAVMTAIGLGTFLLVTLYTVQGMLLNQVRERSGQGEPNMVLFDIQKTQTENVEELLKSFSARLIEEVPIVTMRLAAIKGKPVEEIRSDPQSRIPRWVLRREYRSSYRDRLSGTEHLIRGRWYSSFSANAGPIPVSMERGIAESLRVEIGDRLDFDIQGVTVQTYVASLRQVDWQRIRPNFFVVFPTGVLENAPQFFAITIRTRSAEVSAAIQNAVAERFPNVSVIDLSYILETLDAVLGKISAAIRWVALFTIVTGMAVLGSAIWSSRSQRIREAILLRTLGAGRSQILGTVAAEYLFLGMIAAIVGASLAVFASWALSIYFFKTVATFPPAPIIVIVALSTFLTVAAGMLGCWGIFRRSALETLRAET
ncbi:MAG TPA: FtsX-like permease family protein [Candidatus Binatia bacterium]